MEKPYKYIDGHLRRDLLYRKIHPLRDTAFGADCLIPLRILKIITIGLKKWILVMLSSIVICCKNCQILICSPFKMKSLHLLSKLYGFICKGGFPVMAETTRNDIFS